MPWEPTDLQRNVLRWLADGPQESPPSEGWKLSASTLKARGLVSVSRRSGRYEATITDAGRYYLAHGVLPGRQVKTAGHTPQRRAVPIAQPPHVEKVEATSPVVKAPTDLTVLVESPHPAVRSLMRKPVALPDVPDVQRDAILAADALLRAAKQAGLKIDGHMQPQKRQRGYSSSAYTGEPLVTLDAGEAPVTIRIGELERRVPHVLTDEEKLKKRLGQPVWHGAYDYVQTGTVCWRVYQEKTSQRLVTNSRHTLASYVPQIITMVQRATEGAIEARKQAAIRREEERRRADEARALATQRHHYDQWEKSLHAQADAWEQARRLSAYLDALEHEQHDPDVMQFVGWARAHLRALDPTHTPTVPKGDPPTFNHAERRRLGPPQTPRGWW